MVRRSVGGVNRVDACKAIDDCSLRIRGAVTPDDSFGRSGTNHRAQSGAKRSMGRPTSMLRSFSAALVAFLLLAGRSALADVIEPRHVRVIDGDTITMNGKTIHLVGFVVPETRDAQCKAERELGDKAARRMRDLILSGGLDYSPAVCSCPAATLGKWFCNFGRTCGTLKANGRDVGDILVEEGLAVAYSCSSGGCPKTTKLWCKPAR
jgi:endonuclease YncB( thermonuclease family)